MELNIQQIMEILPHRPPFLLVDRITECEPGVKATGVKCVTMNEPFFVGHFPGNPITPGVCIVQLVTELLEWMTGRRLELRRVVNVKFLHVLSPAERTSVQVLFRSVDFDGAQCRVKAVLKDGGLQLAQLSLICDDVTEE